MRYEGSLLTLTIGSCDALPEHWSLKLSVEKLGQYKLRRNITLSMRNLVSVVIGPRSGSLAWL